MLKFKELSSESIEQMLTLTKELNPNISIEIHKQRHFEMFEFENYRCFGLYENEELIRCSKWIDYSTIILWKTA